MKAAADTIVPLPHDDSAARPGKPNGPGESAGPAPTRVTGSRGTRRALEHLSTVLMDGSQGSNT